MLDLTKTDKSSNREPMVAEISLQSKAHEKRSSKTDMMGTTLNASQLLSNKMFNQTVTLIKSNPFQASKRHFDKNKPKTNLEIYSKTLRHSKLEKSGNSSHQRTWSDIYNEDSRHGNISAAAISARSDLKSSFNQGDRPNLVKFSKHYSDVKKPMIESPKTQSVR